MKISSFLSQGGGARSDCPVLVEEIVTRRRAVFGYGSIGQAFEALLAAVRFVPCSAVWAAVVAHASAYRSLHFVGRIAARKLISLFSRPAPMKRPTREKRGGGVL